MKFIQDERLAAITACMTEIHPINHGLGNKSGGHCISDRILFGRMEAFITKRARTEKLMAQSISDRYWNNPDTTEEERKPQESKSKRKSSNRARARSQSVSSILKAPSSRIGLPYMMMRGGMDCRRLRAASFDVNTTHSNSHRRRRRHMNHVGGIWCRRTYTDLILTLQASFPDYDFDNVEPHYFVSLNVRLALTRIQEKLADYNNSMDMDTLSSSLLASLHNHQPNSNKPNNNHNNNNMIQVYSFCPPWEWQGDDAPSMNHFITESLMPSTAHHTGTTSESATDTATATSNIKTEWQLLFPKQSSSNHNETTSRTSNNDTSSSSSNHLVPLWNFNYFFVNKTLKRIVFFTCVETMTRIPNQTLHDDLDDHDELLIHEDETPSSSSTNHMPTTNISPISSSRSSRLVSEDFSSSTFSRSKSKYSSSSNRSTTNRIISLSQGGGMMSPTTLQSAITDTASFAGYYSVTDDYNIEDLVPIKDDDDDEDEEGLDNDYDEEEGPSKQCWMDDYDMDGDAMGQEAPPLTLA